VIKFGVMQPVRKDGGTGRSNASDGMARVVSMVAAGKRLARTMTSSKRSQTTKSFCFNDNGSMVDLRCEDHASTFQRRGKTLPEDPELVVLHGRENAVERVSTFQWRRQNEMDCWSRYSGDIGSARPPTAEELLASPDGDANSFRMCMWSPTPPGELKSNFRLYDTEYEAALLYR